MWLGLGTLLVGFFSGVCLYTLKGLEEEKGLECSYCSPLPHHPSLNEVNKESVSAFVPDPRPQLEENTREKESLRL